MGKCATDDASQRVGTLAVQSWASGAQEQNNFIKLGGGANRDTSPGRRPSLIDDRGADARYKKGQREEEEGCRIGEAKNPGPSKGVQIDIRNMFQGPSFRDNFALRRGYIRIPVSGDGNCLFATLGYHVGLDQKSVRRAVAQGVDFIRHTGIDTQEFVRETLRDGSWGGEEHLLVFTHVFSVRVSVHSPLLEDRVYGEDGDLKHVLYSGKYQDSEPNHYDILVRKVPNGQIGLLDGAKRGDGSHREDITKGDDTRSFARSKAGATLKCGYNKDDDCRNSENGGTIGRARTGSGPHTEITKHHSHDSDGEERWGRAQVGATQSDIRYWTKGYAGLVEGFQTMDTGDKQQGYRAMREGLEFAPSIFLVRRVTSSISFLGPITKYCSSRSTGAPLES